MYCLLLYMYLYVKKIAIYIYCFISKILNKIKCNKAT